MSDDQLGLFQVTEAKRPSSMSSDGSPPPAGDSYTPQFKGDDYSPPRDRPRLSKQFDRVFAVMEDGKWHTIAGVANLTGDPAQSVARQMRYIRARPGMKMERRHDGGGLYAFRVELTRGT
jgi:hypothetical protein